MYYLALITLLLTIVINIFFGLAVLLRVYQKPFGWYFVLTVLGVIVWAIGDIGILFARDPAVVQFFAQLFYIAPMITPVTIWFFALTFPDDRKLPQWTLLLPIVPFLAIAGLFLAKFDFFIADIAITDGLNLVTPQTPGFYLYSLYFSFFFVMAYIAFFRKTRQLSGINRTQERYILYGVLFGSFLALLSNLSLPVTGVKEFIWLGPFFSLIFPAAATIAIIRHQLFNIRFVLARAIGFILTILSLGILYGMVAFTFVDKIIFQTDVGLSQQFVYAILAVVLAFSFAPLLKFFRRITNRIFYQDAYEPSVFIDTLNRTLVANIELESMLKAAASVIQQNLKVEDCVFHVRDAKGEFRLFGVARRQYSPEDLAAFVEFASRYKQRVISVESEYYESQHEALSQVLTRNNISVLARLVPDGSPGKHSLGCLILSNKKSGNPFTKLDIQIVEIVINEMVIAIQNALRFQEIQNFNRTLQEKIDNATRQLRQKNRRLRLLDQTKDDFISMASHQLRTPLTSVKGYVSMVLDGDAGKVTELQRKLLNQSYISSQRMVYLISDLLNVSRLRTGKFIIEPVPINLADVIESEVEQLKESAKARNLELTYNKPEPFPTLMIDENKLRQVIMNFIDNALYYTPTGGHITVRLAEKPQSIEFTVVDDGIGVPKNEQHHLFSKFYRANNAKRARPDGTGLGLFMAKKVIIAQGGAIVFKSQENKGSTFGFTFPKQRLLTKDKIEEEESKKG